MSSHIRTYTGKLVDPFDLKPRDICIEDIAHALSNVCRFTGHVKHFYSVAQHSVLGSFIGMQDPKLFLLHDASEAYIADIARPIKHRPEFQFYRDLESKIQKVILLTFNLQPDFPGWVHTIDDILLYKEQAELMHGKSGDIEYWSSTTAERRFLERWRNVK